MNVDGILRVASYACLLALFVVAPGYAATAGIVLSSKEPALSVWDTDSSTVTARVEIVNNGVATAEDVILTSVTARGGVVASPTLPVPLGTLGPRGNARLSLRLQLPKTDGTRYLLTLSGQYTYLGSVYGFSINRYIAPEPVSTGPFAVRSGVTVKSRPETAIFPPQPERRRRLFNAEAREMLLAPGPFRRVFQPTPTPTAASPDSASVPVRIVADTGQNRNSDSIPPDPSVAAGPSGLVVLTTVNSVRIRYSLDGGATFTEIDAEQPQPGNPARVTFFPADDGGLCCDQVVLYVPQRNLFVWLIQHDPVCGSVSPCIPSTNNVITASNRLRIAWATPLDVLADFWNAWTWVDLTGPGLGTGATEWLDYPDLAASNDFVYVSVDHGGSTYGSIFPGRRVAARLSLADILDPNVANVRYDYTEFTTAFGKSTNVSGISKSHFVQGAPNRMVLAGLKDTSTLVVQHWPDSASAPTATVIPISSISASGDTEAKWAVTAPDAADFGNAGIPGMISGATYRSVFTFIGQPRRDEYLFAFSGGTDDGRGRPYPYVRIATAKLENSIFSLHSEHEVWNPSYAWTMGTLGTQDEAVGVGITAGGGSFGFPQYHVGYVSDLVMLQMTTSNATQGNRYGDYFNVRPIPGTADFATLGYDVVLTPTGNLTGTIACPWGPCQANPRYVRFGRPPPTPPK